MMMLIHRICMAFSGLGKFISVAKEMSVRAAILLEQQGEGESGGYKTDHVTQRQGRALVCFYI